MELVINERTYDIGRLDAFKQFHVARRLAPVLMALGGAAAVVLKGGPVDDSVIGALGPLSEALAGMSDTDSEYVIKTCLIACKIQQGNGFAPVAARTGEIAFDFIDLAVMLQLVVAVLRENLGNFIPAPSEPAPAA